MIFANIPNKPNAAPQIKPVFAARAHKFVPENMRLFVAVMAGHILIPVPPQAMARVSRTEGNVDDDACRYG